ncbi:MAG: A24 family peptidase C-terminal domain-containing protein [Euryarchaeota archaeon]|nr:A24 family peptidase C-terminal domain-containing protein [Euryarchaeota archaeon]
MIDLIKLFICLIFLLYSCRCDLKTRTVPNELWGVVFVAALPFVIADALAQGSRYLMFMAVSVVGTYVVVYILFWLGAFGGADAKALIALSFIFPAFPDITVFGYGLPLSGAPPPDIFAFSTLANAVLLNIFVPIGILAYNLYTLPVRETMKKPWYLVVGYKCRISDLKGRHIRLIEDFECEGGVVKKRFTRGGVKIDDIVLKRLEQFASRGLIGKRVWVTPRLPFMIPITVGFVAAVVYGDLISNCMMMLL